MSVSLDEAAAARDAAAVMRRHVGGAPSRLRREGAGLSNFVFAATHAEGDFVVRIATGAARIDSYRKEEWVAAHARSHGVPVPEILALGTDIGETAYMLMARTRGRLAEAHRERRRILVELGAHAQRINAISTTGYGHVFDWAAPERARHASWNAYLEDELDLPARFALLVAAEILEPTRADELAAAIEAIGAAPRPMHLNHGDLRLKNVVVDDGGEILAILDWENAISGPAPEWELSLALHDLAVDDKEAFLEGYGLSPEAIEAYATALKALNVVNYAPPLREALERGDAAALARFRARFRGALDLHSV